MIEDTDEECCNSGCNDCVLDVRRRRKEQQLKLAKDSKVNLFDGTYRCFQVISIKKLTENVHRFRFQFKGLNEMLNGNYTLRVPPTHHLFLRARTELFNDSKHDKSMKENYISRPYTPIELDGDQLTFDVLFKLEVNGKMSKYLQSLTINCETEWKGCYGDFIWSPNPAKFKYLVCICQGVAISPMYALVKSILSNGNDETIVHLLACFKNLENCLLRDEFVECRRFWNFNSTVFFSQPFNGSCSKQSLRFDEDIRNKRLTVKELKSFYIDRRTSSIFTLFCGTTKLENVVETVLDELDDKCIKECYFVLK